MRYSTSTMAAINRQLAAVNSGYRARFVPAEDATVDDSIDILLHGAPTRWALQCGDGYVAVNEHGFDANGELEWMQDRGMYRTVSGAVMQLCAILAKE